MSPKDAQKRYGDFAEDILMKQALCIDCEWRGSADLDKPCPNCGKESLAPIVYIPKPR